MVDESSALCGATAGAGRVSLLLRTCAALVIGTLSTSPVHADTTTALGDRTGEGSTPFTGLAQSPEANLFTGAMGTSVPIKVPPGRKSVTPNLALVYSSAGGPSPYGYGWDLPLGRISRSTKWGVPDCNGAHADDFILSMPSGTVEFIAENPGSDYYRPKVEEAYIRAQKFTASNSNYWVVYDRSGLKYVFGDQPSARTGTDTSRFLTLNADGSCSFTTSWALTHIEDPNGNAVDITYLNIDNVTYPASIDYGGNVTAAGPRHFYHVAFAYEDRIKVLRVPPPTPVPPTPVPDPIESDLSGARAILRKRLTTITVTTDIPSPNTFIRSYTLSYDDPENQPVGYQSRLSAVRTADYPPTTFTYADSSAGFTASPSAPYSPPAGVSALRTLDSNGNLTQTLLDMNGDGFIDIVKENGTSWTVYFGGPNGPSANPTTWTAPPPVATAVIRQEHKALDNNGWGDTRTDWDTFDIDGDGLPDFVDARTTPWTVYRGNGAGFNAPSSWTVPSQVSTGIQRQHHYHPSWSSYPGETLVVTLQDVIDLNGDGRPDLVIVNGYQDFNAISPGTYQWQVYYNTGSGFDTQPATFTTPYSPLRASLDGDLQEDLIDFNGDGLPDVVAAYHQSNWAPGGEPSGYCTDAPADADFLCLLVFFNTGHGFSLTPIPMAVGGVHMRDSLSDFVDVNGDGLPDRVYPDIPEWNVDLSDNSWGWSVQLNQGGTLEPPTFQSYVNPWSNPNYPTTVEIPTGGPPWPGGGGIIREEAYGYPDQPSSSHVDLIDFNGDGMLDRVVVDTETNQWTIQLNANPVRPNLLRTVQNGLGGTTLVDYAPSTSFDNRGSDGAPHLPFVTWVTSSTLREDGLCSSTAFPLAGNPCFATGDSLYSEFKYSGGLFDPLTREFRGFRDVRQGDASGAWTHTVFAQDSTWKGRVNRVYTCAGDTTCSGDTTNGTLVRIEDNAWGSAALANTQSTQVWLSQHETWQYDLSTSPAYAVEGNDPPDAYGNVGQTYRAGANDALRVDTYVEYAQSSGSAVHDKPKHTWTVDYYGTRYAEKWFFYDNLSYGGVGNGNVTRVESWLDHTLSPPFNLDPPCTEASASYCVNTSMAYDGFGNITQVTDANGSTTTTDYNDGTGTFLYAHQVWNNAFPQDITITETDYRWGEPSSVTDPNAAVASYQHDNAGRLKCVIRPSDPGNPDPNCWEQYDYAYAAQPGQLSSVSVHRREPNNTNASPASGFPDQLLGYLTATQYFDGLGRRHHTAAVRTVNGSAQQVILNYTTYDTAGRVASRYDPYPSYSGDPASPDPPNNGVTTYDYVLNGNASSWTDPLGRAHTVTKDDGTTRTTLYNGATRTDIDEEGNRTLTQYDGLGRVSEVDVCGAVADCSGANVYTKTAYTYDGAGRVLTTTQNGNINTQISITYDSLGRKISLSDPDSGVWNYNYDGAGNLIDQNDPKLSQRVEYCYDALNRLTYKTYYGNNFYLPTQCTAGATHTQEHYVYGELAPGIGRLIQVTDPSGSTAFTYDTRGRTLSTTKTIVAVGVLTTATTRFTYDFGDHPVRTTYPDNEVVTTTYDDSGQPIMLASGMATYVSAAQYDLFGRLTSLSHGNGVTDNYSYYGQPGAAYFPQGHRLEEILTQGPTQTATLSFPGFARPAYAGGSGGPPVYQQLYYANYTARGLLAELRDYGFPDGVLSDAATFTYDFLGRMTGADGPNLPYAYSGSPSNGYHYDNLGNMTAKEGVTYTYDTAHPHQLTNVSGNAGSISYDANGNRTAKPGQSYMYDANDRLLAINDPALQFGYDYSGQRVTKMVEASGVSHVARYYGALAQVEDGILTEYYFFGGLRVASRRASAPAGLAALPRDPAVQLVDVRPEHVALVVLLRRDVQFGVAVAATLVAASLILAPWRRKRVVGIAVRHGHVVLLILAFSVSTLPLPLVLRPAWAGGSGSAPTPTPTPTPYPTATFGPPVEAEIYHYHYNHLGSVQVITGVNGTAIEYIRYKPYGEVRGHYNFDGTLRSLNSCADDQYCHEFTGYDTEPISGLQYAGARFYDPTLGMFLTHDPVRSAASPYGYCGGDPVNQTDPNGECPWCVLAFIAAAMTFIEVRSHTGDPKTALVAGAIAFVTAGAVNFATERIIGPVVLPLLSPTEKLALELAAVGAGGYATYQSAQHGYYAAAALAALGTVQLAYGALQDAVGAQPVGPGGAQGGNGGSLGQLPGAHAQGAAAGVQPQASTNVLATRAGPGGLLGAAGRFGADVAGKLWALPNTIIGGVVGLAGVPFGAEIQFGNNAIQFVNFPLGEAGEGLTLGNVQIFPAGTDPATYSGFFYDSPVPINIGLHEEAHTFQYQVFGPTFLPAYALSGGISASNPFELAANRYALGGSFFP